MRALGPWELHEPLGAGGMGVVWRGSHVETGVKAAIKTVRVPDPRLLAALRREIGALAQVRHPGVVAFLDHGVEEGVPWYAMAWVEGQTLYELVPRGRATGAEGTWWTSSIAGGGEDREVPAIPTGPVDVDEALRLIRGLCAPLAWLHGEGFVHRDLKPENIVRDASGRPVIVDFGLSWRNLDTRDAADLGDLRAGTPLYMAPEQIRGELVDARADLYALGCMLYEVLAGRPPYTGGTVGEILDRHLQGGAPALDGFAPDVAPELVELVEAMLQPDRRRRIGHAEEVERVLAEAGAEEVHWPEADPPRPVLYRPGLVGRDEPLEVVRSRVAGGAGALWLEGESGIGKTRLALEGLALAQKQALRTVAAVCSEQATRPLDVFRGAFGLAVGLDLPEEQKEALEVVLAAEVDVDLPVHRILSAAVEALVALGADRPTFVLIDDLQWADGLTLSVLEQVGSRPAGGLCLVGTLRHEEASDRALALPGQHLRLEGLNDVAIRTIVGDMLARIPPPVALAEAVAERSRGNPFFAAEYLRLAVDEGLARQVRGTWVADGRIGQLELPDNVRDVVLRRLAGLDAAALAIARALAVVGRPLETEAVREIVGLEPARFDARVHELSRRAVISDTGATLALAHDRIRDVAREDVVDPPALHRRIAQVLDARGAAGVERGRHWERAGDPPRAAAAYARGAREASQVGEIRAAVAALEKALELDRGCDAAIEWLAEYARLTADWLPTEERLALVEELEARLDALDLPADHPRRARSYLIRSREGIRAGQPDEASRWIALGMASNPSPLVRRQLVNQEMIVASWRGKPRAFLEHKREEVARARIAGDPDALIDALGAVLRVGPHLLPAQELAAVCAECAALCEERKNESTLPFVLNVWTEACRRLGQLDEARLHAERGLAVYAKHQRLSGMGDMHNVLGDLDRQAGRVDVAAEHYEEAIRLYRAVDYDVGCQITMLNLGIVDLARGRAAGALEAFDELIEVFDTSGRPPLVAMTRVARAAALVEVEQWEAAAAELALADEGLEKTGFTDADIPRLARTAYERAWSAGQRSLALALAELAAVHLEKGGANAEAGAFREQVGGRAS